MVRIEISFIILLFFAGHVCSYNLRYWSPRSILLSMTSRDTSESLGKVVKYENEPVLTVVDPISGSKIHLVGVSHGASASAKLVKRYTP